MKKIKNYKKAMIKTSILIATILLLAISLNSSFAATVPINNTTPGGINGTITSGTTTSGDTILLAPGNYTGTNNTGITINKNVTIQGNGPTGSVIIDAEGQRRIFNIGNNLNVTFINITFTNGYIAGNGGAISNAYAATTMTFINCTFTNNNVTVYGGVIYNAGANMSVGGSNFINNYAGDCGGAIYNTVGADMSVSGSTFINNSAARYGGAIRNGGSNFSVSGSTFINNTAIANSGGAIYNLFGINMSVSGSTFINNSAARYGGAIYIYTNNTDVSGSTFTNNNATNGGAIVIDDCNNVSVSGSTFTNNTASVNGGGIFNAGNMTVSNNIMKGNNASSANMIYNIGNMGILNLTYIDNSTKVVRWGQAVTLFATLTDDMGNTVTGQNITLIVNGTNIGDVTAIEGYANISLIITGSAGDFLPVSGNYAGHNGYDINLLNGTLLIKLATNSTINVPSDVKVGKTVIISGVLVDENGDSVVNAVINVAVDGSIFTVFTDNVGAWNLTYAPSHDGEIAVVVDWAGNDTYFAFVNNTSFNVTKLGVNSTINVPSDVKVGKTVAISGVLVDENGDSVVNAVINVAVDGSVFTVFTDNVGAWNLTYAPSHDGEIAVVVDWAGNDTYFAFINNTSFNVTKLATNSTINVPSNVKVGKTIIISGVLVDENGDSVVNAVINVAVDGSVFTVITDNVGAWNLTYAPSHDGEIAVVVDWAGNDTYFAFINNTSFNVTKLGVNSTINVSSDVKVGKTITIDGVLVDEDGIVVDNAPITVTVDGKVYPLTTDSNGRWSLTYKPTHTGSINAVVDYAENSKYFRYTNTTTFNVVKGEAIINRAVVKNSDGSVDVIVIVTDEDGDPIPNYKCSIELDDKYIVDIITGADGIGKIHISSSKLSDGKHVITVTSDDVNYYSDPVSVEFETQNNNNDTNKTNNNPVATATMKKTGMPIIAIILMLLTISGIGIRRKQD
ncbi:beta strand repeat-containing protein [Methanobrevibacter cuticularis]|uniref:beta strand repeat-containing protein n=1 Tax=Methanobrevibacter cuticularis TaxID=47311 RepID=UPI001471EC40|nr:hypothetical protein [Methanobrevibacter cuticularis]